MAALLNATQIHAKALKEGTAIVRRVFAKNDCSNGLTTAEIFQLASREPAPQGYKGDPRLEPTPCNQLKCPPQNNHPVRSKAFLKQTILTALVGSQEIKKVVVNREVTAPVQAKSRKGKPLAHNTKETTGASAATPVTVKAWVWKPIPQTERIPVVAEVRKEPFGAPVGVNKDWSHLNRRRQGAREEKIQRDIKTMKRLRAAEQQAL